MSSTVPATQVPLPAARRVVGVGASAGGLRSIIEMLEPLPKDLPCCILVATHLSGNQISVLPDLLARHSALPVRPADNLTLNNSSVYVARPGFHIVVDCGRLRTIKSPPIHYLRPNIDMLFLSIASAFRERAVGVILSGSGKDGADGICAIKDAGGIAVIQDPESAEFRDMPDAARRTERIDRVLSPHRIAEFLISLCT